jgi:hypothetical protein
MQATADLIEEVRDYADEAIPEGGTATDTGLSEKEVSRAIANSASAYGAASVLWTLKAGKIKKEMGDTKRYSLGGGESEDYTPLQERLNYALTMAEQYAKMARGQRGGSMALTSTKPEVI